MAYTCPTCGRTTPNPYDEANRYCPACHVFEHQVQCPTCPRCDQLPRMILPPYQAFCDNPDCDVLSWNRFLTADANEVEPNYIDLRKRTIEHMDAWRSGAFTHVGEDDE